MFKLTLRYIRYALSALATIDFSGLNEFSIRYPIRDCQNQGAC